MQRYVDSIVREKTHKSHHPLIQPKKGDTNFYSSPDSVKNAFQNPDRQLEPMRLRHKRLEVVPDDGSATFSRGQRTGSHLHRNLLDNAVKIQKCQVHRDCKEPAIATCSS